MMHVHSGRVGRSQNAEDGVIQPVPESGRPGSEAVRDEVLAQAGSDPSRIPAPGRARLYCLGLSHRTASLEVRERLALGFDESSTVLSELRARGEVLEAVWLLTCNRVELYAVLPAPEGMSDSGDGGRLSAFLEPGTGRRRVGIARRGIERLLSHFLGRPGVSESALMRSLYGAEAAGAVEHLFRVASGLDSMVLGETEILGQLKDAYEEARELGHTGRILNPVFQGAFRAAKQVRSETGIQRGAVSVASLAADVAEQTLGRLAGVRVLVLGAGDTGEKVTRALLDRGVAEVRIVNRSEARAGALAATLGPRARSMSDEGVALADVDVVVGSTASPGFVLDAARVEPVVRERQGRPLLLLDLAVPRDFDPAIAGLAGVRLLNLDDLQSAAERRLKLREAEVGRCEAILREQVAAVLQRIERVAAPGAVR